MEEEKQLLGTRGFDAAQEGWNKLTGGVSSVIQSGVQAADDFIDKNIPGGEQFTARWRQGAVRILGGTARFVQQELEAADRQVDDPIDHIGDLPYFAVGAFNRGKQQYTENARRMTESAGIDPRAGNVLGEVASEIATFGAGKLFNAATKVIPPGTGGLTPQLATVGTSQINISRGAVNYQPPTVAKLTITDPEFIAPGVKPGIAQTPANIKAREMLDKSLGRLDKRRSELDAMLESGEVVKGSGKFARLDKKIREERYGEMSSFYNNLDQDPPAYRKKPDKNVDPTNEAVVLEQHHLAAKAQTQPFAEVMLEVGDPDDLVALHEYSRMLGVVMGNSRLNMLDAPGPIHRVALAKTEMEKLGNIHSAFSAAGMEPNNKFVRNLLKDAKTSDDVMRVFSQYAQEYLIPQQNIAKKIVKNYFEDYKVNLTASQKARFNELVSKANKGGD